MFRDDSEVDGEGRGVSRVDESCSTLSKGVVLYQVTSLLDGGREWRRKGRLFAKPIKSTIMARSLI